MQEQTLKKQVNTQETQEVNFSEEELTRLIDIKIKLRAIDVFEWSAIKKVLEAIPPSPAMNAWKVQLEKIAYMCDEDGYVKFLE